MRGRPASRSPRKGSLELSVAATPTRVDFDTEVDEAIGTDDLADFSDWFCVRTDPWPCMAEGCDAVLDFLTAAHRIVVWPTKDDRMLLSNANDAAKFGRNPRIEKYEPTFGACIAYDVWVGLGYPVHGQYRRPDDQPFRRL